MLKARIAVMVLAAAAAIGGGASARQAASSAPAAAVAPDILFASPAEVKAAIAKAKATRAEGQPMAPPQPLVRGGGYRALVEYRVAPTPASIHDTDSELFVVLEGSGTLILGGQLQDAQHTNPTNQRGSGIAGGTAHALAPGDWLFAPAGTPHYFSQIGPEGLSVVTLHVPAK